MASIDSLPADQRAVLELVLRRGRSYDEIARVLSIDRAGVRKRALAAFDALGPKTRVAADRRALITDYLLAALPGEVAHEVHEHLLSSASERAWARAIASELQGLTEQPLPEIPANGRRPRGSSSRGKALAAAPASKRKPRAEVPVAAALSNGTPRERPPRQAGSRLGGAILLAVLAAVAIALVLVFVVFSGGSTRHHRAASHRPGATPTHTTANSGGRIVDQIELTPPAGGSSPVGIAEVLSLQGKMGVAIAAEGLAANHTKPRDYYAVWLYNSPTSKYLAGIAGAVGKNGILRTAGGLPNTVSQYHKLLITLETSFSPKAPGRIVLQGTLKL